MQIDFTASTAPRSRVQSSASAPARLRVAFSRLRMRVLSLMAVKVPVSLHGPIGSRNVPRETVGRRFAERMLTVVVLSPGSNVTEPRPWY